MENNLKNQFIIAMPSLRDPNFHHAVALICEHNEEGAMGIVINQPLNLTMEELLEHLELPCDEQIKANPVMAGGPVQTDRGFVVHQPDQQWKSSLVVSDDIAITTSKDILASIGNSQGPHSQLVALGYAGWGAGQLEQEIAENAWLCTAADLQILFHTPVEQRWEAAASQLGIDIHQISSQIGHA